MKDKNNLPEIALTISSICLLLNIALLIIRIALA